MTDETPTVESALLSMLKEDNKVIAYRPRISRMVGTTSAILLQQMYFRYEGRPFYKLKSPCLSRLYKTGDSWCEELGFNSGEFDTALRHISTKCTKGKSKTELLDECPDIPQPESTETKKQYMKRLGKALKYLIVFWTDHDHVTWYSLNTKLFAKLLIAIYIEKLDCAIHGLNGESQFIFIIDSKKNNKEKDLPPKNGGDTPLEFEYGNINSEFKIPIITILDGITYVADRTTHNDIMQLMARCLGVDTQCSEFTTHTLYSINGNPSENIIICLDCGNIEYGIEHSKYWRRGSGTGDDGTGIHDGFVKGIWNETTDKLYCPNCDGRIIYEGLFYHRGDMDDIHCPGCYVARNDTNPPTPPKPAHVICPECHEKFVPNNDGICKNCGLHREKSETPYERLQALEARATHSSDTCVKNQRKECEAWQGNNLACLECEWEFEYPDDMYQKDIEQAIALGRLQLTAEQAEVLEHLQKYNTGNSGDSVVYDNKPTIAWLAEVGYIAMGYKDNFDLQVLVVTDTGRAALEDYRKSQLSIFCGVCNGRGTVLQWEQANGCPECGDSGKLTVEEADAALFGDANIETVDDRGVRLCVESCSTQQTEDCTVPEQTEYELVKGAIYTCECGANVFSGDGWAKGDKIYCPDCHSKATFNPAALCEVVEDAPTHDMHCAKCGRVVKTVPCSDLCSPETGIHAIDAMLIICSGCHEEKPAPKKGRAKAKLTPHTLMKNALVSAMGLVQDDITTWGEFNKASKLLRSAGATPEDIPALYSFTNAEARRKNYQWESPVKMAERWPAYKKQCRGREAVETKDVSKPLDASEGVVRSEL